MGAQTGLEVTVYPNGFTLCLEHLELQTLLLSNMFLCVSLCFLQAILVKKD